MKRTLLLLAGLAITSISFAQEAGDLDTSYGTSGKTLVNISVGDYNIIAQAIQPDGKTIMAGYFDDGGWNFGLLLMRLNADGTIDPTFSGGIVVDETKYAPVNVMVQSTGKIVVQTDYLIHRYNADGTADATFGNNGTVAQSATLQDFYLNASVLTAENKIVAAYRSPDGQMQYIVRYTADGFPDVTFSLDSILEFAWPTPSYSFYGITVQSDGKYLLGAGSNTLNVNYFKRVNAIGTFDTFFGTSGTVTLPELGYYQGSIAQPDGKSLWLYGDFENFSLRRLNSNGTVDATFGTSGTVTTDNTCNWFNMKLALQADGKPLVATNTTIGTNPVESANQDITVFRFNTNGTHDTTFDGDGKFSYGLFADNRDDFAGIGCFDGKIILTGNSYSAANFKRIAMVRLTGEGAFDATFSTSGKRIYSPSYQTDDYPAAMAIRTDGKVMVGGTTFSSNAVNPSDNYVSYFLRMNADGSVDNTFGLNGKLSMLTEGLSYLMDIALQGDNKILASGLFQYGDVLVRLNENGAIDTSFAVNGFADPYADSYDSVHEEQILPLSGGKILLGGQGVTFENSGTGVDFFLTRLNSNGTNDTTFGTNGVLKYSPDGDDDFVAMRMQADGKLVVAGSTSNGSDRDIIVMRFNSNGTFDTAFNGNGKFTIGIAPESDDVPADLVIQPDGKIVVIMNDTWMGPFRIIRLTSAGSLDTTFGTNGMVGPTEGFMTKAGLEANGKIVLGGILGEDSGRDCYIRRYNANGMPDLAFGTDGVVIHSLSPSADGIIDMTVTPENKLLTTGYAGTVDYGSGDTLMARFLLQPDMAIDTPEVQIGTFFPNPALDRITFTEAFSSVRIFDIGGKLQQIRVEGQTVFVSGLASGTYLVDIVTADGKKAVRKLVKK